MRAWLAEVRSRTAPVRSWDLRRAAAALDLCLGDLVPLTLKCRSRSSKVSRGVEKNKGDGQRARYVESSESDESDMKASCAVGGV